MELQNAREVIPFLLSLREGSYLTIAFQVELSAEPEPGRSGCANVVASRDTHAICFRVPTDRSVVTGL